MQLKQSIIAWTILLSLAICVHGSDSDETEVEFDLLMPDISPTQKDIRLCHGFALDTSSTMYITDIVPHANADIVHHICVVGCQKPGSDKAVWTCRDEGREEDPPFCEGTDRTLFMSAQGLPSLHLPDGVGFKVGGDSEIQSLVLQIHYKNADTLLNGGVDHSGVRVTYTNEPLPHLAALLTLETDTGVVQPGQEEHIEMACSIDDDIVMHPFAFHIHSHQLGRVISGYRVRGDEWTEIGRRSPQMPNAFVPANPVPLTKGDMVAARCTMFNFKDQAVNFGPAPEDEMCYFEILYYTDGQKTLSKEACVSPGPPEYYWKLDKNLDVSKVPAEASVVPSPEPTQLQDERRQSEHKRRTSLLEVLLFL